MYKESDFWGVEFEEEKSSIQLLNEKAKAVRLLSAFVRDYGQDFGQWITYILDELSNDPIFVDLKDEQKDLFWKVLHKNTEEFLKELN